ncbi:MAG: exodeoxyribonuclease VII, large subunit [Parcubacteria bacterium C7867-006]|nr:MAG: exodeoxyribonuclease VII, large subunit [Parcubacteria bacterium C7867-006]
MLGKEIVPVGLYIDKLNSNLKQERVKIVGEVSGLQMYEGRSYLYFNIKDTKEEGTLKCFMWKRDFTLSGVPLKDGLEIIITAYPSIYKPNGGFTMQTEAVELVGEGALKIAYDQLKTKLEKEGLFSPTKKREIPMYPHKIGVITSRSGAVINDFLTNIGKFGFEILFVDSKVEGVDAIKDLLGAINTLKNEDIDVLVIMRGGGSLESFQAFNNEVLVRAVADFPVPVLTGIGHDKDEPIVSMVSDMNVSTPTAVANLLNSTWSDALSLVQLGEERIFSKFQAVLRENQSVIENSMVHMENGIKRVSDSVATIGVELIRGFSQMLENSLEFLVQSKKILDLSNPERQLAYGYSIVKSGGKIVKSIKDVSKGQELDISVKDGIIHSQII